MIRITSLHIYPVKSLRGIDLPESVLGVRGLEYDRSWMVSDSKGKFITQRHYSAMATIRTEITEDQLILHHPNHSPLEIPLAVQSSTTDEVIIWDDQVRAIDEGGEASSWLTAILGEIDGKGVRLFRYAPEHIRPVKQKHLKGEDAHTAFADGFPFLVTSEASLNALNQRLKQKGATPVGMDRFRPNIVIEGVDPFQEDQIQSLTSSTYALGLRKPCQRCHVTTIDQQTGQKIEPKEPLRTLVQMNTQPQLEGGHFGQNAVLLSGEGETMRVGDALRMES